MEHISLVTQSLEDSLNQTSLKFKDPELEAAYSESQASLRFLRTTTKRFIIFLLIGQFLLSIIDFIMASGASDNYSFTLETWIVSALVPIEILLELLFYCYSSLAVFRGLPMTILGTFIIFHNNYDTFQNRAFYPYNGTE